MKVLVVEDAPKLSRFLSRVLNEEGYAVDLCGDGDAAISQIDKGHYDLVILDWMLPGVDGLTVCREIRSRGVDAPVLMLTARGETSERVLGLDAGADDFLVKPFEVEELVARVRALLRRGGGYQTVRCGPLQVDRANRTAEVAGEPLSLTSREFALLLHLAHHADQVVKRTQLLTQVWETRYEPGSNIVEVQISRLRDKLGDHAWMIETVRGVGYRLRSEVG